MKKPLLFMALACFGTGIAWGTLASHEDSTTAQATTTTATASAASSLITDGKNLLAAHDILNARNKFSQAVAADSTNQEAQLLYGVTRVLAVYEDGQSLNTSGLDSVREILELSGFIFSNFNLYDTNGTSPNSPANSMPTTGAILDFLNAKLLPEVNGAIDNLNRVTSLSFASSLSPAAVGKDAGSNTSVDYADVQVMKALLHVLKCNINLLRVYGLNVSIPSIKASGVDQFSTYKTLFQNDSTLLTPNNAALLSTAKTALMNFIDTYNSAVTYVSNRTTQDGHLFVLDVPLSNAPVATTSANISKIKDTLADIKASLSGPHILHFIKTNNDRSRYVDLSQLFDAEHPINFRSKIADNASGIVFPDKTFGGLFPMGLDGLNETSLKYRDDILGVMFSGRETPSIEVSSSTNQLYWSPPSSFPPAIITIKNRGTASLHVSSIALQGANSTDFTLSPLTCPSTTPILAPTVSCTMSVTFNPKVAGLRNVDLRVNSDDNNAPLSYISLHGYSPTTPLYSFNYTASAIIADPATPSTIYAGTQGGGVAKSTDGGSSWAFVNNGLSNLYVYDLSFDPANSSKIFAATNGGLYTSADSGTSWSALNTSFTQASLIRALPGSSSTMFAANSNGLYRSTDSGTSWGSPVVSDYISSLSISKSNPTVLYAGGLGKIYKSTNSGASWSLKNSGMPSSFVYSVAIDPGNDSIIYVGTNSGLFKSTNGGDTWTSANTGLSNMGYTPPVQSISIDTTTPSTIYAGTNYYGVYISTDSGATWSRIESGGYMDTKFILAPTPGVHYLLAADSSHIYKVILPESQTTYSLTVGRTGTGTGNIKYSTGQTSTSASCSQSYPAGTDIILTPEPGTYSLFNGWSGCDTLVGNNQCRVTMHAAKTVNASFKLDTSPLSLAAAPAGGTYSQPPLVSLVTNKDAAIYYTLDGSVPTTLSTRYSSPIQLTGNTTLKYMGVDANGTNATKIDDYSVNNSFSLTAAISGSGSINSTPSLISLTSGTKTIQVAGGTELALNATPGTGYLFSGWSGSCTGNGDCSITMNSDKLVTAAFEMLPYIRIYYSLANTIYYPTFQAALDAFQTTGVLQVRNLTFDENLLLNNPNEVFFRGGYVDGFGSFSDFTKLDGQLTIGIGTLIVDGLTIK